MYLWGILHLDHQYFPCSNLAPEVWDHYFANARWRHEILLLNIGKVWEKWQISRSVTEGTPTLHEHRQDEFWPWWLLLVWYFTHSHCLVWLKKDLTRYNKKKKNYVLVLLLQLQQHHDDEDKQDETAHCFPSGWFFSLRVASSSVSATNNQQSKKGSSSFWDSHAIDYWFVSNFSFRHSSRAYLIRAVILLNMSDTSSPTLFSQKRLCC